MTTYVHAYGRDLLAGLGSYTDSSTAAASHATGYVTGRGGLMEAPGVEVGAATLKLSRPRGRIPEMADIQ